MKKSGQIVLFRFPYAGLEKGKPRPALLITKVPGKYDDWLICMLSSKFHQHIAGMDEVMEMGAGDYEKSGLNIKCIIRVTRLAIVSGDILLGALGSISDERLFRIKNTISSWIKS